MQTTYKKTNYLSDDAKWIREEVFVKEREYMLGRIAIIKECRGKHLGNVMLHLAEQLIVGEGGMRISLSAQTRAKEFYKKNGYIEEGAPYFEEYCEHIHMEKKLVHI